MRAPSLLLLTFLLVGASSCKESGPLLPGLGGEELQENGPSKALPPPPPKNPKETVTSAPENGVELNEPSTTPALKIGDNSPRDLQAPAPPPPGLDDEERGKGGELRHQAERLEALPVVLGPDIQCKNWPLSPSQLSPEARADIETLKGGLGDISLSLTPLSNGGRVEARSNKPNIATALKEHVKYMSNWLRSTAAKPETIHHEIYRGLATHAEEIYILFDMPKDGVRVEETGSSPEAITFVHAHLALIERYVKIGNEAVDSCQSLK